MERDELVKKVIEAMGRTSQEDFDDDDLYTVAQKLNCQCANGATRMVLIFPKLEIVIKFPYGSYDYCAQEVKSYKTAVERRVEKLLLPIEKVGVSKGNIPLYVQPMYMISVDNESRLDTTKIRKLTAKTTSQRTLRFVRNGLYYAPNANWTARAIQLYGKKFMRTFEAWTREFRVNDLHSANVGYLKGYRPVLIDYAGYNNYW